MDFRGIIKGLHHVTATVNDAKEDYDFYTGLLGLRLVKETVNFDNERVYHFYYANETGSPSTVFTTFPYKGQGVRPGVIGYGQVYETAFSVPDGAFAFWRERLKKHGVDVAEETRFGQKYLVFKDPSGLRLSILKDGTDQREPVWTTEEISQDHAIRGVHHVTLAVDDVDEVVGFLEPFGYNRVKNEGDRILMKAIGNGNGYNNGVNGNGYHGYGPENGDSKPQPTLAGKSLVVLRADEMPRGVNGLGTVHHVAHRVGSLEDSLRIKTWLEEELGIRVTDVRDRKYFQSIYFRIPGGILFEVATEGPGFLVDESLEELGSSLRLPDWQEKYRDRIEENLTPYRK
jgi:glyoxalase family protein